MCKCKKTNCSGGCGANPSNSAEQLANQVAELTEQIETLTENAKFLLCGHPILLIEHADDIAQFDLDSGKGIDCWDGWAICNGGTHFSKNSKKNITTPNFTDRFIVQAGGNYDVDDTGGYDEVTLDITEIPAHNHGVTDPGHTHNISDPGHLHAITDDMHVHQINTEPHSHSVSLGGGAHSHTYVNFDSGDNYKFADVEIGIEVGPNGEDVSVGGDGQHTHNGNTDASAVSASSDPAATGIEIVEGLTGITATQSTTTGIATTNQGGGLAHENRPPFYAAFYVMKL